MLVMHIIIFYAKVMDIPLLPNSRAQLLFELRQRLHDFPIAGVDRRHVARRATSLDSLAQLVGDLDTMNHRSVLFPVVPQLLHRANDISNLLLGEACKRGQGTLPRLCLGVSLYA